MPTAGRTHHLTIEDTAGTNRTGLMIQAGRRGWGGLVVAQSQVIQPRRMTMGELTRAEFPVELQGLQVQEDWISGIGGQLHRLHPASLAESAFMLTSAQGVLRPAPDTLTPGLDSNPTNSDFVPSGFAVSGEPWAFVGAHPYRWDYSNTQWDRIAMPLDPTTGGRIYRNGVSFGANEYVSSWADDIGSGGSYVIPDVPSRYLHRSRSLAIGDTTTWTMPNGSGGTDPDSFKHFAVVAGTFWGGHIVDAADSTNDVQAAIGATVSTGSATSNGTTLTVAHTVDAGTKGALIVVVINVGGGGNPTGVTWNGAAEALTLLSGVTNTGTVSIWYLANPTAATDNVVATWGSNNTERSLSAFNCYGVNQTTPMTGAVSDSGTGTSASSTVTTTVGDLVVDGAWHNGADAATPGAGQTERYDIALGIGRHSATTEEATTTSTVMSQSWGASDTFAQLAATIQLDFDADDTFLPTDGVAGLVAGDVIRVDSELMLVTAVQSTAPLNATVVRGYRGTVGAAHSRANIYEMTRNPHQIRSTSDPTTLSGWSGATSIGDSSSEITGLHGIDTDLYIFKTDGIYQRNSSGTVTEILPELRSLRHPDNGKGGWTFNRKLFYPLGNGGLLEIDPSSTPIGITDVSFSKVMPDLDGRTKYASSASPNLHGRIVNGYAEAARMYVLVLETGQTRYHLLSAENVTTGSTAQTGRDPDYRWSHIARQSYTTGTDADHAAVYVEATPSGSTTHHRVHFGIESTGSNLTPFFLPLSDQDAQWAYEHTSVCQAITTELDVNLPNVDKTFASLEVHTRECNAGGRKVVTDVSIDGGAFETTGLATILSTANLDQRTTLTFTAGTTGRRITIRFTPSQTTAGSTPVEIVDFTLTVQIRADALRLLPLRISLRDQQRLLNGAIATTTIIDYRQLLTWKDQAAEVRVRLPSALHPSGESSFDAVFLPQLFRVQETAREVGRRPEYIVDMALAEV